MRRFNVTGLCTPDKDYMVDISDKIEQIRAMVDMEETESGITPHIALEKACQEVAQGAQADIPAVRV